MSGDGSDVEDGGAAGADDVEAPLVSVVIPTYFRNERLRRAIESVLDQTHPRVEVVVVDGSGEAHARPVAESFGEAVRYVAQETDQGAHAARSEGAELARGDYVNFLDDDDRLHPEKLARQLAVFDGEPDPDPAAAPAAGPDATPVGVGVVYCAVEWEDGHVVRPDPDIRGDVLEYALRFRMTPSSPSAMLIDAAVLDALLPLGNRHGADDMGMKIELAQRTRFAFVDEPLLTKGAAEESLGGSRENIEGRFELLERYADLYDSFPDAVRRDALAHTYLLSAEQYVLSRPWSPRAIRDAALACYHVPGLPVAFAGFLLATLLGRPGERLGRTVYRRFVLGDEHRGKLT